MRWALIIAAAGSGTRLEADRPKAFVTVAGAPLLSWSVERLGAMEGCRQILVPAPEGFEEEARRIVAPRNGQVVRGGARRQDSVWNALAEVDPACELVAVHDAARPCVACEDVRRTCARAAVCGGAILARPVTDTLKEVAGQDIVGGASRERLWAAETPQVFGREVLLDAFAAWPGGLATDEAQLVSAAGVTVEVVEARQGNPKLTYLRDLAIVEFLLARRVT